LAIVSSVRTVILGLVTIAGISLAGAPALLVAPIAADALMVTVLLMRYQEAALRREYEREEAVRLLKEGFPLGASSVVYWVYRLVGTTSIAATQSGATLGQYTFANGPITLVSRALAQVYGVLTPALWGRMATATESDPWRKQACRLSIAIAAIAGFATNVCQAGYGPAVSLVAPKFAASIPIFEVVAGDIVLLALPALASLALTSTLANQQGVALRLALAGVVLNAAANAAVLAMGFGALAIAWNDVSVQLFMAGLTLHYAAPWLASEQERARLYQGLGAVVAWTLIIAVVLHALPVSASGIAHSSLLASGRLALVIAAWLVPGVAIRRSAASATPRQDDHAHSDASEVRE
jgi:hypothetical protein